MTKTNVEIKATVKDMVRKEVLVREFTQSEAIILHQVDVFFVVPKGRLKLRIFSPAEGELIYYERPDTAEPKSCSYCISKTNDPQGLKVVLEKVLRIRSIVKKKRLVYLYGQTRIHLDKVEGLGNYIEIEVVLSEDQTEKEASVVLEAIMSRLEINPDDLVDRAYVDLLAPITNQSEMG